jgi:hypothetical protein
MSKGRIAPVRPSIAKILKRQIGGFVREYEREVNRPAEPPKKPPAQPVTPPVAQSVAQPIVQPDQEKGEQTPPTPQSPDSAE